MWNANGNYSNKKIIIEHLAENQLILGDSVKNGNFSMMDSNNKKLLNFTDKKLGVYVPTNFQNEVNIIGNSLCLDDICLNKNELIKLKELLNQNIISEEEFEKSSKDIDEEIKLIDDRLYKLNEKNKELDFKMLKLNEQLDKNILSKISTDDLDKEITEINNKLSKVDFKIIDQMNNLNNEINKSINQKINLLLDKLSSENVKTNEFIEELEKTKLFFEEKNKFFENKIYELENKISQLRVEMEEEDYEIKLGNTVLNENDLIKLLNMNKEIDLSNIKLRVDNELLTMNDILSLKYRLNDIENSQKENLNNYLKDFFKRIKKK
tara:strand:+ start:11 stop:979 length:969 start_codon:yes stop_codon:yes gene_type:complete